VEDQTSLLHGSMQEDPFEVVMRGYNKRQVDDYVLQCQHHIRDLAQRLALAEQEVERVRSDAATQLEKASSKPVHEEVSERLAQILRLASEEAERERQVAADEIAALRAQTLAETQALRAQAQAESDELREQAAADSEGVRAQAKAETDALRQRIGHEAQETRQRAEAQAVRELEQARLEAEQLLTQARDGAERDVAQAHAEAQKVEESARAESERLLSVAQARADAAIGEAERRATAINTVLGTRLELLTTTHADVLARLLDVRTVLVETLTKEEAAGPFAVVPSPAEAAAATARSAMPVENDPYVQTAGEVAAAYEATEQQAAIAASWRGEQEPVLDVDAVDAVDVAREAEARDAARQGDTPPIPPAPVVQPGTDVNTRGLDLSGVAEKTRR
jgi:hypothetical protein